jgi:hypothetical protein
VHAARERPAPVEVLERGVVDLHDDQVVRRLLPAADLEPRVDRVELGVAEGVEEVGADP